MVVRVIGVVRVITDISLARVITDTGRVSPVLNRRVLTKLEACRMPSII